MICLFVCCCLQDPSHADADPQLVFEDMTMMTDFELHNLSLLNPVKHMYMHMHMHVVHVHACTTCSHVRY